MIWFAIPRIKLRQTAPNFVRAALLTRHVLTCTLGGFAKRFFLVMHRFGAVFQPHQIAPNRAIERITASTPLAHQLMYALYIRVAVQGWVLALHLNIAVFNFQTMHKVRLTLSEPHCSNVVAVISTAQMSFRGAKRRGNPQNRNEETVAVATDRTCFRNH